MATSRTGTSTIESRAHPAVVKGGMRGFCVPMVLGGVETSRGPVTDPHLPEPLGARGGDA